jgi:hypothetical protein
MEEVRNGAVVPDMDEELPMANGMCSALVNEIRGGLNSIPRGHAGREASPLPAVVPTVVPPRAAAPAPIPVSAPAPAPVEEMDADDQVLFITASA